MPLKRTVLMKRPKQIDEILKKIKEKSYEGNRRLPPEFQLSEGERGLLRNYFLANAEKFKKITKKHNDFHERIIIKEQPHTQKEYEQHVQRQKQYLLFKTIEHYLKKQ